MQEDMEHMRHPYIALVGMVGSGKTTLARLLGEALGAQVFEEVYQENPFLERYYQNMSRWALHTQLAYFVQKMQYARQALALCVHSPVVQEGPPGQDLYMYGCAQQALGYLSADEFALLERLFLLYEEQVFRPDLYIVIRASDDLILQRIQSRGRAFEQSMAPEYLAALQNAFNEWTAQFPKERTLEWSADEFDVVADPQHRDLLLNRVKEKLPG